MILEWDCWDFAMFYFGSRFLLILVGIDLMDFGRNGFGHWACGMDGLGCCLAGSMEMRGRLSGRQ